MRVPFELDTSTPLPWLPEMGLPVPVLASMPILLFGELTIWTPWPAFGMAMAVPLGPCPAPITLLRTLLPVLLPVMRTPMDPLPEITLPVPLPLPPMMLPLAPAARVTPVPALPIATWLPLLKPSPMKLPHTELPVVDPPVMKTPEAPLPEIRFVLPMTFEVELSM